MMIFKTFSKKA